MKTSSQRRSLLSIPAGYKRRCEQSDFPGETVRVLKGNEARQSGEHRTRRPVLEVWDRLR
ncbi:MAG: hypothetical protein GYA33_09310 [Thermogutta sp.]|nr:hypothetical protein [Thermogutta sp.]